MKVVCIFSVSKFTKQLVLVKSEKSEIEQELEELRHSHRDLKQKYDKLVLESQGHVTQEQHIQEISEIKQYVYFLCKSQER